MTLNPVDSHAERSAADPRMVNHLMTAMAQAIDQATIPHVTTTADLLSAVFTVLDHTLRVIRDKEHREDQAFNSREIGRVLANMLLEFGVEPSIKH